MLTLFYRVGIALFLSIALFSAVFGFEVLWQKTLDIQLHNTYFVVSTYLGQISFFVVCLLAVCLLDMIRWRATSNRWLLLAVGVCAALLVLFTTDAAILVASMQNVGWTIYPPLEASKQDVVQPPLPEPSQTWDYLVRAAQIIFLLITIWASVAFGKLQARQKA
ncbi:hypothetical protein MUN82_18980 [Hymenobacter aerilatus]|uniref:DUF4149 domain-containing protein n=1 Tax=Hymenobacter aerilatus TaxID=2932251 RepID=A0A8T9SSA2_9BACT|nr:hypothetical protein [Hymenobacter aerilatus]UOR05008.1 hypothetical protein MUN82_18980 [Hymenobacter aerilatus]